MPAAAARTALIEPFYVMEVVKEAAELAATGRSVIHLSIGEPDFTAPEPVRRAACAAIERGETQYTGALGLEPLRERIADWYATRFGCQVDRQRIVVTAGASAALLLACAALLERDAEVLMPDPSYPCNRHFATAFGGRARLVPCGPDAALPAHRGGCRCELDRCHRRHPRRLAVESNRHIGRAGRSRPADRRGRPPERIRDQRRDLPGPELRRPAGERAPAHRRGARHQQFLQVLQHDRVASRLDRRARRARSRAGEAGAEPVHLPVDHRAARRARLFRRSSAGRL